MSSELEIKLGFDRIRLQVEELCTTISGREKLNTQTFTTEVGEIEHRLALSDEMRLAISMEQGFPSYEFADFGMFTEKIAVEGSYLEAEEALVLRAGLKSVSEVLTFFEARKSYEACIELGAGVASYPWIVNHIDTLIDRTGEVKDSASPELYSLRRQIRDYEGQAAKRLQAVLARAQADGLVDADAAISIRDGRPTIPVAAANKRKINGFVQDESASGRTVYIEPVEVVEINNVLRELEYAARREVIRILTELTALLRGEIEGISRAADYLTHIDMLRAKARWAVENNAGRPIISTDGRLLLRSCRHPLLEQTLKKQGSQIVPLDLKLDPKQKILVISGPNAGGKSVCLKSVGLLQYMFQCGFLLTAGENSELPIFEAIMLDIGDEQSIDNDLSTYSSHLQNMKRMLSAANTKTLFLIDEFGSGTEPVIGGAIAEALLERFIELGTYGVITTHYSNIKYFASLHKGVANGAMMFDVQNIRPLFRLQMGEPGSSFAIEIARKIGLPEAIIGSASKKVGSEQISLEKQLRDIARDRRYWEQKRERIRLADKHVEELETKLALQLEGIKSERNRIVKAAKTEAEQLLTDANRQIENTIRTIRESQADKELTKLAREEVAEFREKLEQRTSENEEQIAREMERITARRQRREQRRAERGEQPDKPTETKPIQALPIIVGAKVRITGQEGIGEVREIKGKKASVAFGLILTNVATDRLIAVSNAEAKKQLKIDAPRTNIAASISERKLNFKDTLDVRGERVVEAIEKVQDFIDTALMVSVAEVRILHGKGTGALKEEIRRFLKGYPQVASTEDDHADRGGAGITIVRFNG